MGGGGGELKLNVIVVVPHEKGAFGEPGVYYYCGGAS